ncbi:interleukin-6 receptor subunit beta [Neolamprologus brichardi]|uniref:interleukin-6 receptor subunit beta n=1 Tax=Neolamprologus brichardi TaxID=32507 RepID=UPI0016439ABC|nr:interleukin-6 receptor subunit beta [Neolamprologus brichardi]
MERSPAVLWTWLLGAGLVLVFCITTSTAFPRPPRLIGCVFIHRVNVTCHWEPGDTPTTKYTLQVEKISSANRSAKKTYTCTTHKTTCTIGLNGSTSRIDFCITVTAHGGSESFSSHPRCQPGRTEVMLPPATLNNVTEVRGSPQCLNVTWSRVSSDFPVSNNEIQQGNLNSQIETVTEQLDFQIRNVTMEGYSVVVCHLRPDTEYTIRLRHRYRGPASPWSMWSKALQGRTAEDAPSAAPVFWRRVKQNHRNGWRLVSLLWKPLPHFLANGKIVFYNVTCQTESTPILSDHGSCKYLHHLSTSCSLLLPAGRSFCTLTASTSAGVSPKSKILLHGSSETATLYTYTRQGTPSAGIDVKVQQISGGMVELTWSPVPVELLRGFLRNYTLYYRTRDQPARSVFVPGQARSYTLQNLSPGNYAIFMQANTEAGAGETGTIANVHIRSEEISVVMYVVVPLVLTILALILMACLAQHGIVKEKLCKDVPDPSNSSLSHWAPKTTLESMNPLVLPEKPAVKYSEVIVLGELENSSLDQDHSYQGVCNLRTYSSLRSPLDISRSGKTLTRRSATDLSPCCSDYSSVMLSGPLQNTPGPLVHLSCDQYNWQTANVNDVKLQLGGASEPSQSQPKDEQKTLHHFLQHHQIPASFSDLSSISSSAVLPSHTTEISSLKHPFSQSSFNSLLQSNNIRQPSDSSDNFTTSFSQFLPSIFVDFSYCPVECDPYISSTI